MTTCFVKLLSGHLIALDCDDNDHIGPALENVFPTPDGHQMLLFQQDTHELVHPSERCGDHKQLLVFYQPIYEYILETPEESGSPYFEDQHGTLYRKWEIRQIGHELSTSTYFFREVHRQSAVILHADEVQQIHVEVHDEDKVGRIMINACATRYSTLQDFLRSVDIPLSEFFRKNTVLW
jgi:hypothetical protein